MESNEEKTFPPADNTQSGKDGYNAVQLGFGSQKPQRIAKPALGHLVKHGALDKAAAEKAREKGDKTALAGVAKIKDFRNFSKEVKPGESFAIEARIKQSGGNVNVNVSWAVIN